VWQDEYEGSNKGLCLKGVSGALATLQKQIDAVATELGLPPRKAGDTGALDLLRQDLDADEYILEYDVKLVSKKKDIITLRGRSTVSNLYGGEAIGAAPDRMQTTFYTAVVQPFNIKFQKSLAAHQDEGSRTLSVDSAAGMHHEQNETFNSPMRISSTQGASGMGRG